MVTFVGKSGSWAAGGGSTVPWPAGTAAGDLGVIAVLTNRVLRASSGTVPLPEGWSMAVQGSAQGLLHSGLKFGDTYPTWEGFGIAWKWLTSADLAEGLPRPADEDGSNMLAVALTVWRDTAGVGGTRGNAGYMPVGDAGGLVCLYKSDESGDVSGDVTPLAGGRGIAPRHIPYSGGQNSWTYLFAGYDSTTAAATIGALGYNGMAVEILGPQPPGPPVWVEPVDGQEVAHDADLTLTATHRPATSGGKADAYRVQVAVVTGGTGSPVWDRWLATDGTLSSTQQTLTQSPSATVTATVADSVLVNGDAVHMRMVTREATDQRWSDDWSDVIVVHPVTAPTATVTGPTGTVTDDLTPTVTYTIAGGVQGSAQARITGPGSTGVDDEVVWDSGPVSTTGGSLTASATAAWTNGGSHTPWARVRTVGGVWSPWASGAAFTMSWTPPAAPTVTAAAADRGVDVTVTGGDADDEVELERLDPVDGWVPVSAVVLDSSDPLEVSDLLAPWGVDVTYRARVWGSLDGARIPGAWGTSGVARSTDDACYLIDAEQPLSRSLRVRWRGDGRQEHQQVMSVTHGIGDPRPRVATGTYRGRAGTWTFRADTLDARAALEGFIHSTRVLTLRTPPEREPDGTVRPTAAVTVRRSAPLSVDRVAQVGITQRDYTLGWVEADPVTPRDTQVGVASGGGALVVTGVTTGPGGTLLIEVAP